MTSRSQPKTRRIAWDGVSFDVPETWDLAGYEFARRVTRLELEDDFSVRLQAEWVHLRRRPEIGAVRRRYLKAAERLARNASGTEQLDGLPEGWTAFLYTMPERRRLAIGFAMLPATETFAFFQLHFGSEDGDSPGQVLHILAESLRRHQRGLVPWIAYDMDIELPAIFRLDRSSFQAGLKMLAFRCGFRKLHIWQASLADMALSRQTKEQWAVQVLNSSRLFRGVRFVVDGDHVKACRSRLRPFGHYDEIGRWCFHYFIRCDHDHENNRLFLWVFNCRGKGDLPLLHGRVGPVKIRIEGSSGQDGA